MKLSVVLCGLFLLCISVHVGGTETLKQEDLMALIKQLITKMNDMSDRFEKRDDEITEKMENLEISTIERMERIEVSAAEKIEKLEINTIKRVQKIEANFKEAFRVHKTQIKEDLDFRDLRMTKMIRKMRMEFSQRLNEEQQQIEKLKEENAAMKREMKKCIEVKDLSKNVSSLVEKQNDLQIQQIKDELNIRKLKNKVNETLIEGRDVSRKVHIIAKNVSHLTMFDQDLQHGVKSLNGTLHAMEARIGDEVRETKNDMKAVTAAQKKEGERLTMVTKALNNTQRSITNAKEDIARLKDDSEKTKKTVIRFQKDVTKKIETISTMNVTILNEKVKRNTKSVNQVQTYLRYDEYKEELHLSFEDLLQLTGEENFIKKNLTIIQKLVLQLKEFRRYERDWGISYEDVIRLTDGSELYKHTQLSTIRKLVALDNEFTNTYKRRWGIEFKDVVRLTTREDMRTISVKGTTNSITVLNKIQELYVAFLIKNKIWNVPFKGIVELTPALNFTDAAKSPALVLVSSWFEQGFTEVWGKEAFHSFFHAMMDNEAKRPDFLAKISKIATMEKKKRFLKFLPGKFTHKDGKLSVQGFIQIWYHGYTGTVRDNDKDGFKAFTNFNAKAICREAGYSTTTDGWSNGKFRDESTAYDRSNIRCLISGLQCKQDSSTIEEDCINDQFPIPSIGQFPSNGKVQTTKAIPKVETTKATPKVVTTKASQRTTHAATTKGQPKPATTTPSPPKPTTQPWKWHWDHRFDVAIKCNL